MCGRIPSRLRRILTQKSSIVNHGLYFMNSAD